MLAVDSNEQLSTCVFQPEGMYYRVVKLTVLLNLFHILSKVTKLNKGLCQTNYPKVVIKLLIHGGSMISNNNGSQGNSFGIRYCCDNIASDTQH